MAADSLPGLQNKISLWFSEELSALCVPFKAVTQRTQRMHREPQRLLEDFY